jgi:hypothetical protein
MTTTLFLLPSPELQFCDANGQPYAGGTVGTFTPGTMTQADTWLDSAGVSLNTNPIVLDAAGRCLIYTPLGQNYRMILRDVLGNLIWDQISITTAGNNTPGVFTNTQMNQPTTFIVGSINLQTEYQAEQGGNFTTDAVAAGIGVPSASTVYGANAVAGYVNNDSPLTNAVAGYFQARASTTAKIWGLNPLVDDGGFAANIQGIEVDINSTNGGSSVSGVSVVGVLSGAHSASYAFVVQVHGSPFEWAFNSQEGAAVNGLTLGATSSAANSVGQPILLYVRDASANLQLVVIQAQPATAGANLALFAPTGNINLDSPVVASLAGVFTNTQLNAGTIAIIGGISPSIEYHLQQPGNYATQAIASGVSIPSSSTVHEADALFGCVANDSTVTNAVAVAGYVRALVAGSHNIGANILVNDGGLACPTHIGCQWDINAQNTATVVYGNNMIGAFPNGTPGTAVAYQVIASSAPWRTAFNVPSGSAIVGLQLGAAGLGANSDGQPINLFAKDASGTDRAVAIVAVHQTAGADLALVAPTGNIVCDAALKLLPEIVATLPAPSSALLGCMMFVTDAMTPSYFTTVVGGGASPCPVFCDGTAWVCH